MLEIKEFEPEMPSEQEKSSVESISTIGQAVVSYAGEEITTPVVDTEYIRDNDPIGYGL